MSMALYDNSTVHNEKPGIDNIETVEQKNTVIDHEQGALPSRASGNHEPNDPNDPLNWSMPLKISILLQISLLAALGTLNTAIINPAYAPLASSMHITTIEASYQTTAAIALNGLGPFLWIPLANTHGRRPVLLGTTALGFATILGAAYTTSFAALVGLRVVNGLWPAAMALGPAVVVDCFALGQRGRATGVFTVLMTTGAHVAPIVGGLVGAFLGWRWCFRVAAVADGVMFVVLVFAFPETLYFRRDRNNNDNNTAATTATSTTKPSSYLHRLRPYAGPFPLAPKLRARSFVLPVLRMARYPSVLFPAIYYGAQYGFGSILPAVTVAAVFSERFGWHTLAIGLAYGGALTVGGVLGEFFAGPVLDALVRRAERRKRGDGGVGRVEPEERLKAVWIGAILLPVGLLIYGFTIQYRVHWFVPLFGMGLSCFGLQPIATTCYTYSIDCHRAHGGDVATLFNFVRQMFGMTFAFYAVRLCQRIGYQFAFVLFAVWGSVLAFVPIVVLMFKGREIREWARRREGGASREEDVCGASGQ